MELQQLVAVVVAEQHSWQAEVEHLEATLWPLAANQYLKSWAMVLCPAKEGEVQAVLSSGAVCGSKHQLPHDASIHDSDRFVEVLLERSLGGRFYLESFGTLGALFLVVGILQLISNLGQTTQFYSTIHPEWTQKCQGGLSVT